MTPHLNIQDRAGRLLWTGDWVARLDGRSFLIGDCLFQVLQVDSVVKDPATGWIQINDLVWMDPAEAAFLTEQEATGLVERASRLLN
jgi:hypothetical protein